MNQKSLNTNKENSPPIYISFDSQDAAFADLLSTTLLRANFTISPHRRATVTGEIPSLYPERDLKESFVLIFICTSIVQRPYYVDFDWAYAIGANIPVLPILLGNTNLLHPRLMTMQLIDFSTTTKRPWEYLVSRIKEIQDIRDNTSNNTFDKVQTEEMSLDVFLSYSRKDNFAMERVRDDLRNAGLKVWVDTEGLEPGTVVWERSIEKAIQDAGCILTIMSPDAKNSEWVARELATAGFHNKLIYSLLVDGDESTSIPLRLATSQWIDGRKNYKTAFESLVTAIKKYLGK